MSLNIDAIKKGQRPPDVLDVKTEIAIAKYDQICMCPRPTKRDDSEDQKSGKNET